MQVTSGSCSSFLVGDSKNISLGFPENPRGGIVLPPMKNTEMSSGVQVLSLPENMNIYYGKALTDTQL